MKHTKIHLTEPARSNAAAAVYPYPERGPYEQYEDHVERCEDVNKLRAEFTGPHFKGTSKTLVQEGCVVVVIDGDCYIYPLATVARVKSWTEPDAPAPAPDVVDPLDDCPS